MVLVKKKENIIKRKNDKYIYELKHIIILVKLK